MAEPEMQGFLSTVGKSHKKTHDNLKSNGKSNDDQTFDPFPNFSYTGTLRPLYPLSPRREVLEHIPRPDYAKDGIPYSERLRSGQAVRKLTEEEQKKLRLVCQMAREVLDLAARHARAGVSTDEIDAVVHQAIIERGAYPSPLHYREFPKSVCTSVNEVICHGIPDQRKLQTGDIVNIDVSVFYDGFHGDVNGTYGVGEIDSDSEKVIRTARLCLDEAIKLCKPGALFRDLGKVIEPIARRNGCSVVRTYCGHGIHELFHCAPNVPHYAKNKAIGTMKPGMAFTIEPMINLGTSWYEDHWPDKWTAVTIDGKRSAQFEETLLITEDGVEILTAGSQ